MPRNESEYDNNEHRYSLDDSGAFPEVDEHDAKQESKSVVWRISKALIVLVLIGGLLYVYGGRQFVFFTKTPDTVSQETLERAVDAETITVPLRVFVLSGNDFAGSARDTADVHRMIENAARIWNQASVGITATHIETLQVSDERIQEFYADPESFIRRLPAFNTDSITVVLVRHLHGINGVAFGGARSIAVADYTTSYDFRVFAHEIGHVLGLGHVQDKNQLMYSGARGTLLLPEEIQTARAQARRYFE